MAIRGEFIRGDGLAIPNNLTSFGAQQILMRAIQGDTSFEFFIALVEAVYTPDMEVDDLSEPTIGAGGYTRIALNQDDTDWPTLGQVNDEWYIESKALVWEATGDGFDKPITRMAIVGSVSDLTGDVFCLSGALPSELVIDAETPEPDRTFRYRLYSR